VIAIFAAVIPESYCEPTSTQTAAQSAPVRLVCNVAQAWLLGAGVRAGWPSVDCMTRVRARSSGRAQPRKLN